MHMCAARNGRRGLVGPENEAQDLIEGRVIWRDENLDAHRANGRETVSLSTYIMGSVVREVEEGRGRVGSDRDRICMP